MNQSNQGIWHEQLVCLILGLTLILLGVTLLTKGFTELAIRENIRWTAQLSFVCFCIAFGASSFHLLLRNSFSFWILMNRKYWGISFALIHLIHLLFLVILQQVFHPVFEQAPLSALLGGGIAYLFLVLMLITSFDRFAKMLSARQWKWLHKIGGYWIWAIFMSSYFTRLLTEIEHLPYVMALIVVLGIRILTFWKYRK